MRFRQFFFAQGEDAKPYVDLLDDKGIGPLLQYMDNEKLLNRENAPERRAIRSIEHVHEHADTEMIAVVNYRFPYLCIGKRIRR